MAKNLQIKKIIVPLHRNQEIKVVRLIRGVVVQLVRIPACHAGGRGFESRPYRKRMIVRSSFFVSLLWQVMMLYATSIVRQVGFDSVHAYLELSA